MSYLLSEQGRLLALIAGCAVLWSLESLVPLYRYERHRLRRALPNIGLAVLLVLTNLVLSFATAGVASFVTNQRMGLLFLFSLPAWLTALLGSMALDLFTY